MGSTLSHDSSLALFPLTLVTGFHGSQERLAPRNPFPTQLIHRRVHEKRKHKHSVPAFIHLCPAEEREGMLALTALLLCGLAIPTAAQTFKVAPEQGFTISPEVSTSIVLIAFAGARCGRSRF
jgi:hypothetical protein